MGSNKAVLPYQQMPMALRVATALRLAGCANVTAVGGDAAALATLGLPTVDDLFPGEGALGGVISALEHFAMYRQVAVIACDLPLLRTETVQALVNRLDTAPAATDVVVAVGDRQQPLCSVWKPRAATTLREYFLVGNRRVLDAIKLVNVIEHAVAFEELRNVNTAADLAD